MYNDWSVEDRIFAIEESKRGATAAAIAQRLGRTRNSVIGMLFRARGKQAFTRVNVMSAVSRPKKVAPKAVPRLGKIIRSPIEPETGIDFAMASPLKEREGSYVKLIYRRAGFECSYVIGETQGKDTICCGESVVGFGSWCQTHRDIVFRKNIL